MSVQISRRFGKTASAFALLSAALLAVPASALDLTKLGNPFGGDWRPVSAAPDLVRFSCGSVSCPPKAELTIAIRPVPDEARDGVIADPEGTVAGYERGFKNNPANKACEYSDFKGVKGGGDAARFEMTGECPSGLMLKMATMFDKRQQGFVSVVASSMDAPRANGVRAQAVDAVAAALAAAP